MTVLNERYEKASIITIDANEKCVYHPKHMSEEFKWILHKDIVFLECFDKDRDLVIIPFMAEGKENLKSYDFIFM